MFLATHRHETFRLPSGELFFSHRCRMALALARILSSCRPTSGGRGLDGPRKGGNGSRERTAAARSLIAFAFRLDVIVVSTLCLALLILLGLVRACLP